ncbi:MAG: UDP-N-acetylmuramoyl-L-alanine--D-glutamate ligase [Oscillospiraceae bacterium]|nr:UDP-N-acetylmuramoyl-L-alanine--D-glutamate ligase [Oscillospiraceae bacterium]
MNAQFSAFLDSVRGRRCAVIGMGVSNTPLIRLLLDAGASVLICDKKEDQDEALLSEFRGRGAEFCLGEKYLTQLSGIEIIFKTPGMRYDVPELIEAEKEGSIVTTEMEQFLKLCPCTSIGITGSDGKTTTTTVVGELLKRAGKCCHVGGNIGRPLLPDAGEMREDDFAVIELSSFQLMNIKYGTDISVITNITPNHLDVHKSMEEYTEAKKSIFKNSCGRVVLNFDNEITRGIAEELGKRATLFSSKTILDNGYCIEDGYVVRRADGEGERILALSDIKIPGMHNVENYMAAIAATEGLVSKEDIVSTAREFGGVEHRMELVRELHGVKYYNDSIASSPTRTIAGLRAFNRKVILIAGGYDKNIPFDELGPAALEYVKTLVLVGATAEKIKTAVESTAGYSREELPIIMCNSFEDAVNAASAAAQSGDIVTLSPACASFDMFKNFMLRGERFRELVMAL